MASPEVLAWLVYALAMTVGGLGAFLAIWAFFWDRARGRRRCPRCWYEMSGISSRRCPECGHDAKHERRLFRTRRRWRPAALGLLLMLPGTQMLSNYEQWQQRGLIALIPSTPLILWAVSAESRSNPGPLWGPPRRGQQKGALANEVLARYRGDSLARWQHRLIARSHPRFQPDRWIAHFTTRPRWPEGGPIVLWADAYAMAAEADREVVVTPLHAPGAAQRQRITQMPPPMVSFYPYALPLQFVLPTSDTGNIRVRIELFERSARRSVRIWSQVIERPVRIEGSIEDFLTPVDNISLEGTLKVYWSYDDQLAAELHATIERNPDLTDVTLGLRIEFRDESDELVATSKLSFLQAMYESAPIVGDLERLRQEMLDENPDWYIRIVGDPYIALRNPDASSYWQGTPEIPLTEIISPNLR